MPLRRHRNLPGLIAAGSLLVLAAVIWREQLAARPGGFGATAPAGWREASASTRRAALASIETQLLAFKRGDYTTAVVYQSSNLKRKFRTLADFRRTMEEVYPQFTHYRSVDFGPAWTDPPGRRVRVSVRVMGGDGVKVQAEYSLLLENGLFRVDEVRGGFPPPTHIEVM